MNNKSSVWQITQKNIMTGISYMIPIVVGAGMLMGIGAMAGQIMGFDPWSANSLENSNQAIRLLSWFTQIAGKGLMNLMYPVFAAYLAYGIGDKIALGPGFLGGVLAQQMGSGFLGSILIGLIAGYFIKYLNKTIKIKRTYIAIKTMFIIPVLGAVLIALVSKYIVGPIGIGFINGVTAIINSVGKFGNVALSAILAGSMAFDLGGPVNKTALTIGMQLNSDSGFSFTPILQGIVIAPIGIGLATMIDKFIVGRKVFPEHLSASGGPSLLLGLISISEGAIPFAISDPLWQIPINVIGTAIGASVSAAFGCYASLAIPGAIWGWQLITKPLAYVLGIAVGVSIVALASIFRRLAIVKKEEKNSLNSESEVAA